MTSYSVEWAPRADQLLAGVWLFAPDRAAVTAAAAWLDAELARNPLRFGSPIDSSVHRVGSHDCRGIESEVIEGDNRVIVHGVFAID